MGDYSARDEVDRAMLGETKLKVIINFYHGCHRSGNGQGKQKFFKVREMSGNFILGQGKLSF